MQIQGGFGISALQPMARMGAGIQPAQISRAQGISTGPAPLSGEAKQLAARAGQMKGCGTSSGPSMMGPELFSKMVDQSSPSQMQSKSSGTKALIFAVLEGIGDGLAAFG
jgi:hypothetical protein